VNLRYCPACRRHFVARTVSPPYAAMEVVSDGEVMHVDPITHEPLQEGPS
jgi:hypothetical protein